MMLEVPTHGSNTGLKMCMPLPDCIIDHALIEFVACYWAHFTVLKFIFVLCIACMCRLVTW